MSINLLVLYEIADKASKVTTRRAYREFERWAKSVMEIYNDSAIERAVRSQLFRLKMDLAF